MSTLNMATMDNALANASTQNMQLQQKALQNLAGSDESAEAKREKLREASEGFEAIFIQQMWEEMRASLPKDGLMSSSKEEQFWQGMYDEELAKSMASSGGIGLADMMMDQLEAGITDVAVKPNSTRSNGLSIAPAPLLGASQNAHLPNAPLIQTVGATEPVMQAKAAPIMDMNIYEPSIEIVTGSSNTQEININKPNTQEKPSQNLDNGKLNIASNTSSAVNNTQAPTVSELDAGDAIVTIVTYQTNLPESKRQTNMNDLITQVQANHQAILNEQAQKAQAAPIVEELPEMELELVQSTPIPTRQVFSNEPQDILSGIKATYVKSSERVVDDRQGPLTVQQALLQPLSAGGPDLLGPARIVEAKDLAYVNPKENSMASPLEGKVSSGFGWRLDPYNGKPSWHNGVDVKAKSGTAINAADDGVVTFAGHNEEFGNMVVIEHPNGLKTIYAHAESLDVKVGDAVIKGTEIAKVGSSGRASGPHLHFEIRKNDMPINPESVYPQYFMV